MESSQSEEERELTGNEFLVNLIDVGFQKIDIIECWFEFLTVAHSGTISSLLRVAKISNRFEVDIFFYSFALEVYKIEEGKK